MGGVGYIPADPEFLEALREACDGQQTLLSLMKYRPYGWLREGHNVV